MGVSGRNYSQLLRKNRVQNYTDILWMLIERNQRSVLLQTGCFGAQTRARDSFGIESAVRTSGIGFDGIVEEWRLDTHLICNGVAQDLVGSAIQPGMCGVFCSVSKYRQGELLARA